MQGRRYLKRVWRVQKDQGAAIYLAALLKKMMRKHGWPADVFVRDYEGTELVRVFHVDGDAAASSDFWIAYELCARNLAYTHSLHLDIRPNGYVVFLFAYAVHRNFFKRIKNDLSGETALSRP